jgi:hypothetical protein
MLYDEMTCVECVVFVTLLVFYLIIHVVPLCVYCL